MPDQPEREPFGEPANDAPRRREPFINAPLIVVGTAALLVALYAAYYFAPVDEQGDILYNYALAPERFWAPAGSPKVYNDLFSGLITLLSTSLLHGDWLHVIVNSGMLLAFGTPVARALGSGLGGTGKWMLLLVVSIIAGSALYLALKDQTGAYAVGASGGVSGLVGAAFLLDFDGRKHTLWSRQFLMLTGAFAAANAILTLIAPFALGMGLAWEAHVGGYVAGAVLMAVLPVRGYRAAEA